MSKLINKLKEEYPQHLEQLQQRTKQALSRENIEGIVIPSCQEVKVILDENTYPFKVNPHFKHWLPLVEYYSA